MHPETHLVLHCARAAELRAEPTRAVSPPGPGATGIFVPLWAGPLWRRGCG